MIGTNNFINMENITVKSESSKQRKGKIPKTNKERARAHRERKKHYIDILEDKNKKLELEIANLQKENYELKEENHKLSEQKQVNIRTLQNLIHI